MSRRLLPLLGLLLGLLQALEGLSVLSVVDQQQPDDEYIVEHQVTRDAALARARELKLYPGPSPGCKSCTSQEDAYCRDGSVLEDHCCCDSGSNEELGFVEHTCRVGPEACQVRAGDCAEYTRLRDCCCYSHLASLWKRLAGGAECGKLSHALLGLSVLVVILLATVR